MKKILQVVAILFFAYATADAALIHSLHIKKKGPRGFKDVGEHEGVIVHRKWCIDPGTLSCPYICNCGGTAFLHPNTLAGESSAIDLQPYEKDFIKTSLEKADQAAEATGTITEVYQIDGVTKVITAKFGKSGDSFIFAVVENDTYEQNLAELASL